MEVGWFSAGAKGRANAIGAKHRNGDDMASFAFPGSAPASVRHFNETREPIKCKTAQRRCFVPNQLEERARSTAKSFLGLRVTVLTEFLRKPWFYIGM
jgi:hypothetical protein